MEGILDIKTAIDYFKKECLEFAVKEANYKKEIFELKERNAILTCQNTEKSKEIECLSREVDALDILRADNNHKIFGLECEIVSLKIHLEEHRKRKVELEEEVEELETALEENGIY